MIDEELEEEIESGEETIESWNEVLSSIGEGETSVDLSGVESRLDEILEKLGDFTQPPEGEEGEEDAQGVYFSSFAEVVEYRQSENLADRILTKSFDDYSTTEGLLLALVLLAFLSACVRIIREGFSWL